MCVCVWGKNKANPVREYVAEEMSLGSVNQGNFWSRSRIENIFERIL